MNTKLTSMALTALIAANSAQVGANWDGTPADLVLASEVTWEQLNPARGNESPKAGQLNGTLTKLPAGFSGKIDSRGSTCRAVVIKGQLQYQMPGETDAKTLEPGSYFSSKGESVHQVSSEGGEESIFYVRTDGKYDVVPAK